MTKLEERLNEAADQDAKLLRPQDSPLEMNRRVFKAGARAVLELPELKAVFEALEFYAEKNNYKEGSGSSTFGIAFGEVIEEPTYAIWDDEGEEASEAICQWRSFIGEVDNE